MIGVSLYLADKQGLSAYNLGLLAQVAALQDEYSVPIFAGGDFNMKASRISFTDILERSRTVMVVPSAPTCYMKKSKTTIDYFWVAQVLGEVLDKVEVDVQHDLAPHRPVSVFSTVEGELRIRVLRKGQRLPTKFPFGPVNQFDEWDDVREAVEQLEQYLGQGGAKYKSRQKRLDKVYSVLIQRFVKTVSRVTDTPLKRDTHIGTGPDIIWVPVAERAQQVKLSWKSYAAPVRWLKNWVIRIIESVLNDVESIPLIALELDDAPAEFGKVPALIDLHARAYTLQQALCADVARQALRAESANAILDSFLSDVARILDAEKAKDKASAREAWRAWVLEHTECNSGWIHRWTKPQEVWAPSQVERTGEWKGQPTELLAAEADRLHGLWQAVEQPLPAWQCEDDIVLPPISGEDVNGGSQDI